MRIIQLTKIQASGVYPSSMPCDFHNAYNLLSPTAFHNWSKMSYFMWLGNKDILKCFCFLTRRRFSLAQALSAWVMLELSEVVICLQLRGSGLSAGAICLELENPEGLGLLTGIVCLWLGGPILANLGKFEKNWYYFVIVSNITKNVMWNNK